MASTTFDLPEPLGPTTAVIPVSKFSVVEDANDLKPRIVRLLRYTWDFPDRYGQGYQGESDISAIGWSKSIFGRPKCPNALGM